MPDFIKNAPIRRKVINIVMIICTMVLLAAYIIIASTQWQSRHQQLRDSISTLANVVGINSSASLAFIDSETGQEILSALKSEEQVISAELFSQNGQLFASYKTDFSMTHSFLYQAFIKAREKLEFLTPETSINKSEKITYRSGYLKIIQKIHVGNRVVGSIHLRACLHKLYDSFFQQLLLVGGLLLITLLVAYVLANQLQKFISRPVQHLANTMQKVSKNQDYSVRATAESTDELGDLINGFNNMLVKVQQHEEQLSQAINNLNKANDEAESAKNIAEQANQSKSEFLANMSHELRTPMHAILSFSNIGLKKLETVPPAKLGDYFSKISQSGNRLMTLLNDLLDLAKLEAGKIEFKFGDADLAEIIDLCAREQETRLQEQAITLNIALHVCKTKGVFDQVKIGQVVTNLLSNSIKFTPEGKQIFISVVEDTLPTGHRKEDHHHLSKALRLTVRDEGFGVPKDEFEDVFDKFIQSSKTKSGAGGTGLGLAICKEIIEGHNGYIWVENSADGGAMFSFIIPVNCADFLKTH